MSEDKTEMSNELSSEELSKGNPYENNPLTGVGLKTVLQELVTHYGFDILYAYLNINCFKSNPSLAASTKFLKKTEWAREKVEIFYLYQFKNLPRVSSEQFNLPPRERVVPANQKPGEPAVLTIEDGEYLQEKRAENADSYRAHSKGSSRAYNDKRNAGHYKSRGDSQDSQPSYYSKPNKEPNKKSNSGKSSYYDSDKSSNRDSSESNNPSSPKDPWGNFKPKK